MFLNTKNCAKYTTYLPNSRPDNAVSSVVFPAPLQINLFEYYDRIFNIAYIT